MNIESKEIEEVCKSCGNKFCHCRDCYIQHEAFVCDAPCCFEDTLESVTNCNASWMKRQIRKLGECND